MSRNVINNKFLSLLCQLNIDKDQFPDKSFDGLFETGQDEVKCFLEWFVDNISTQNALTETEIDYYSDLRKCKPSISRNELNCTSVKSRPSYEDLEALSENYIQTYLVKELQDLKDEFNKLQSTNSDIDEKYSEIKKKQNSLREECNQKKKKLSDVKVELQMSNSNFLSIDKDIVTLKADNNVKGLSLQAVREILKEEDNLFDKFSMKNIFEMSSLSFINTKPVQLTKLKSDLKVSKYLSIVSKSILEEIKYKNLKAEEFLSKLNEESNSNFTFDEVLSIWRNVNEYNAFDNLKQEIDVSKLNELYTKLNMECDSIWDCFLCKSIPPKLVQDKMKIFQYLNFMNHVKSSIVNNKLLLQVLNKSLEMEKDCASLVEQLYYSLNEDQNTSKNILHTLQWKIKRNQEFLRHTNEKHALLLHYKKLSSGESLEKTFNDNRTYVVVKSMFDDTNFYSSSHLEKLERGISASLANILSGPTNQIYLAPIGLQLEMNQCRELIADFSHLIKRLVTEYVNAKESISSSDRRLLLMWIDFLTNPRVLTHGLEAMQNESMKSKRQFEETTFEFL